MVLWRHCHADVCEVHVNPEPHAHAHGHGHNHAHAHDERRDRASAMLILIGDGFHNVLDGVLIAAAFMTDVHLGIVTALAVIAHEIPQEVGDLAILLHGGMSRTKAFALNLFTSSTSVIGGVGAYFALAPIQHLLPYALAIAASSFLYIAVADLIPGLHRRVDAESGVKQFVLIVLGIAVIFVTHALAH
jgi:zinc and cadmium transporter